MADASFVCFSGPTTPIKEVVAVIGGDKGGPNTTMLIRVANHTRGNMKDYSQVLAQYEDGVENYSNMAQTIYKPGSIVQAFMQDLMDDNQHAIVIQFNKRFGDESKVYACKCTLQEIFECDKKKVLEDVTVTLLMLPGVLI